MPFPRPVLPAILRPVLRPALSVALVSLVLSASPAPAATPPGAESARASAGEITRVVVISVDGLASGAITQLGASGTPTLHRLMAEGASTLNARTDVEMTVTLPNHTSMVTGRRVDRALGGHGVTWDDDRLVPRTVQAAAGHPVSSVFTSLRAAGLESALFAAKTKFSLFSRSWPLGLQRTTIDADNAALVRATRRDLATQDRALTFLHLSLPDLAGHAQGWMSPAYLTAVRQSDALIGRMLTTIEKTAELWDHTLVIVTTDHGGQGYGHSDPRRLADYRIPFLVWGPGVASGRDLYALNADQAYADPGTRRVGYAAPHQPVRNGDVANLVLDVLGLPAVPQSELDAAQDLEVMAN